jgi:predicted transcriptional regulator
VREIHEQLSLRSRTGYSAVLKLLRIMQEKGLVTREGSARTHVYAAAAPQQGTRQARIGALLERPFGGSAHRC